LLVLAWQQILIACGFERIQEGDETFFTLSEEKATSITGIQSQHSQHKHANHFNLDAWADLRR
jgi:hypothetical protein